MTPEVRTKDSPNFYRLFRRRYYRTETTVPDASEEGSFYNDRERYTVAAIAFCLQHNPAFCEHFWQNICKVPGDPDQMPSGLLIRLVQCNLESGHGLQ